MEKKMKHGMDMKCPGGNEVDMNEVRHSINEMIGGLSHCIEALGIETSGNDGASSPVLMLAAVPGQPVRVADVDTCFDILGNFGISDTVEATSVQGLFMAYDPAQILELGGHSYLTGPVIFYRTDADNRDIAVTIYDVYHVQEMVKEMAAVLCANGTDFPAFILN